MSALGGRSRIVKSSFSRRQVNLTAHCMPLRADVLGSRWTADGRISCIATGKCAVGNGPVGARVQVQRRLLAGAGKVFDRMSKGVREAPGKALIGELAAASGDRPEGAFGMSPSPPITHVYHALPCFQGSYTALSPRLHPPKCGCWVPPVRLCDPVKIECRPAAGHSHSRALNGCIHC